VPAPERGEEREYETLDDFLEGCFEGFGGGGVGSDGVTFIS